MSRIRVEVAGRSSTTDDSSIDGRPEERGEESGTPPEDRRFRPDVEGLRAVAVLLVVLFHAGFPGLTGGFVGVDVFFVISGFVITGLLLRERQRSGRTSVLDFYARRCRRILPAAILVIVAAVLASYPMLGALIGNSVADDGRWAAAFLVNVHFAATSTDYFASSLPPSPLQNYWSLSVEEQFYVVYPTIVLVVARVRGRLSLHTRLAVVLVTIIAGSYWLSIVQTATHPTTAYFSPFTRAWELALGGLAAVLAPRLKQVPRHLAAVGTWIGLAGIVSSAFVFNGQTAYPGSLVAIPVVGSALIIAGGVAEPGFGSEILLGLRPCQWLGRRSYSLYLWHWPILIIAAERVGRPSLPLTDNILLLILALAVTVATYRLVENPIRHLRVGPRTRSLSVALGVSLSALTIGLMTVLISVHSGALASETSTAGIPTASLATVRQLVDAAPGIRRVPPDLTPPVRGAYLDFDIPATWTGCRPGFGGSRVGACSFGDPRGTHLMILYGDSHALMWARALNDIAIRAQWRFVLLTKPGCPVSVVPTGNPQGFGTPGQEWVACDQWRQYAVKRISRMDPDLLVVTQQVHLQARPGPWGRGLQRALSEVTGAKTKKVVLGNIPLLPQLGPVCLSQHTDDVQRCTGPVADSRPAYQRAERAAASATGSRYVDVLPWFCNRSCTSIIGRFEVYADSGHVTNTYAQFLEPLLADALGLPPKVALPTTKPDLSARVVVPAAGGTVSGATKLIADAPDTIRVTKVEFRITGGSLRSPLLIDTTPTLGGWIGPWNTAAVPNGTYTLRSVAHDAAGKEALSPPVRIEVHNGG